VPAGNLDANGTQGPAYHRSQVGKHLEVVPGAKSIETIQGGDAEAADDGVGPAQVK
jgi:hypothetical protein